MTILRVGTNQKYSDGWEAAFKKGKKGAGNAAGNATAKKKSPAKKPKKARK